MYDLATIKSMGLWKAVSLELMGKYNLDQKDVKCEDGCEDQLLKNLAGKTAKNQNDLIQEICCMAENLEVNRRQYWH